MEIIPSESCNGNSVAYVEASIIEDDINGGFAVVETLFFDSIFANYSIRFLQRSLV
jgi:hypothetical protein